MDERLVAETSEFIRRLEAVSPDMIKAIEVFGDQTLTVRSLRPWVRCYGCRVTTADLLSRVFEGTPLQEAQPKTLRVA